MKIKHLFREKETIVWMGVSGVILVFALIGLYHLPTLPAEWFGDISTVNNYVSAILHGGYPLYFNTSAGPVYFYLIAPLVFLLGQSYLVYKLLSWSVGAVGLVCIYIFAQKIVSKKIALLTMFLSATSFWYVVWSRLGNFNIITPLLTALTLYFFFCYKEERDYVYILGGMLVSSLGLFTYAGTFLLPFVFVVLVLWESLQHRKTVALGKICLVFLGYVPILLGFWYVLVYAGGDFKSGYLGTKIIVPPNISLQYLLLHFGQNVLRLLGMLHLRGDGVFRWNIPGNPHLDPVSGILFLLGTGYYWIKKRKEFFYLLTALLLLPLPSIFPTIPLNEVPSSPRTLLILPLVMLFVAGGIDYLHILSKKILPKRAVYVCIVLLLFGIVAINLYNYFIRYPQGLPLKNVAVGQQLAAYIQSFPENVLVYMSVDIFRGDELPNADSIYYALPEERRPWFVRQYFTPVCNEFDKQKPALILLRPREIDNLVLLQQCFPEAQVSTYLLNSTPVVTTVYYSP